MTSLSVVIFNSVQTELLDPGQRAGLSCPKVFGRPDNASKNEPQGGPRLTLQTFVVVSVQWTLLRWKSAPEIIFCESLPFQATPYDNFPIALQLFILSSGIHFVIRWRTPH